MTQSDSYFLQRVRGLSPSPNWPAKFYIVQPALQRLAGRARPGALVVGRELAQVVP